MRFKRAGGPKGETIESFQNIVVWDYHLCTIHFEIGYTLKEPFACADVRLGRGGGGKNAPLE